MNPPPPLTTGQVVAAAQKAYDASFANLLEAGVALCIAANAHRKARTNQRNALIARSDFREKLQIALTEDAKSSSASVLAFGASLD